jgi:hypothetical protein
MSRPVDIIVTGGVIVTMDPARRLIRDGAVAIEGATRLSRPD